MNTSGGGCKSFGALELWKYGIRGDLREPREDSASLPVLGHPAPVVDMGSSFYLFMVNLDTHMKKTTYKGGIISAKKDAAPTAHGRPLAGDCAGCPFDERSA